MIDTCLSPHMTLLCQSLGHVYTCGHTYMYIYHMQGSEYLLMFDRRTIFSSFVSSLDVKHAKKLACHSLTKSLSVTFSELKILHTGGNRSGFVRSVPTCAICWKGNTAACNTLMSELSFSAGKQSNSCCDFSPLLV